MYSLSDLNLLLRATLRIYRESLVEALRGCLLNWKMVFVHFLYLVLCSVVMRIALAFGPVAGGFVLGFFLAAVLANYLFTVSSGVRREKVFFGEVWSQGFELFSPTLSVLFCLFILTFVVDRVLSQADLWLVAVFHLLVAVLFNPIPEIIYTRPGRVFDMLGESFEFIRENFIEWFLPALILGLPLVLVDPDLAALLGLQFITTNPLHMIEYFLMVFYHPVMLLTVAPLVLAFVFCMYFVFIFRGHLYQRLSTSTRRKRIYQERFQA